MLSNHFSIYSAKCCRFYSCQVQKIQCLTPNIGVVYRFVSSMLSFDFRLILFYFVYIYILVFMWIYVCIYVDFVGSISVARRKCGEDSDRSYEGTARHVSLSVGRIRSQTQGLWFFFFFFLMLIFVVTVQPWFCFLSFKWHGLVCVK